MGSLTEMKRCISVLWLSSKKSLVQHHQWAIMLQWKAPYSWGKYLFSINGKKKLLLNVFFSLCFYQLSNFFHLPTLRQIMGVSSWIIEPLSHEVPSLSLRVLFAVNDTLSSCTTALRVSSIVTSAFIPFPIILGLTCNLDWVLYIHIIWNNYI